MLFRTAFMFEGKHAAEVLLFLSAIGAVNVEGPVPVTNAQVKNGRVVAETTGAMEEIVFRAIPKHHLNVDSHLLRQLLREKGYSTNNLSYLVSKLTRAKKIKSTKQRGIYEVLRD